MNTQDSKYQQNQNICPQKSHITFFTFGEIPCSSHVTVFFTKKRCGLAVLVATPTFFSFFRLHSAGGVAATYLLLFLLLVVGGGGVDISAVKGTLCKNLIFDRNFPPNAH